MSDLNEKLFDRAQESIPGGVNSPVRAFRSVGGAPRFIKKLSDLTCMTSRINALLITLALGAR